MMLDLFLKKFYLIVKRSYGYKLIVAVYIHLTMILIFHRTFHVLIAGYHNFQTKWSNCYS